ncbi:hypothetical protein LR48_Vigan01g115900 [Vigna angularis]|uniref:Uncharacterized protein n=1 Tax=Phaseolus angularis TaxID=3914 RepID=A0A0L9TN63_PHAAN|nr:hypothetical protein LR48_Vigan01g115900 [Vigna angularis]
MALSDECGTQNQPLVMTLKRETVYSTTNLGAQRKEIDASYYTQYCALDEPGYPMPLPQPPRSQLMRLPHFRCGTSRVAWPIDPSQTGGRARAPEASSVEEDTEDEEDAEDEEEAEDEEDSDDYD